jgi:hypothetical protein
LIAYSGIQSTTAINVPAETWQIDFTARLDGIDERERLSNFDIYGHEAFLDTGWMVVRQGSTDVYDVLPGVGYVGGIRIASAVAQQVTVSSPPASIWVDVSLQGDVSDKSAVVAFIADAVSHDDYTDGNGFEHYLTKLADIDGAGNVVDVRTGASLGDVSPADLTAMETSIYQNLSGRKATSPDYPVVQGGLVSFTHGLSQAPTKIAVFLRCLTAEFGYSVGDVITLDFANFTATSFTHNTGGTVKVDGSLVQIRLASSENNDSAVFAHDWTTGERAALTNANWVVFMEVEW